MDAKTQLYLICTCHKIVFKLFFPHSLKAIKITLSALVVLKLRGPEFGLGVIMCQSLC